MAEVPPAFPSSQLPGPAAPWYDTSGRLPRPMRHSPRSPSSRTPACLPGPRRRDSMLLGRMPRALALAGIALVS